MSGVQTSQTSGSQTSQAIPRVNLFAKAKRTPNGVEWDLDFVNPPQRARVRVDLPKHSGPHEINFHLVATHGLQIDFDASDPIWVCENCTCPPPPGINTDQITVLSCINNLLKIRDENSGPARDLTYQLNFVGADAAPLDPEIRNGGNQ